MNMTGVALIFSIRQYQIREQVQQQILKDLPESSLQTFRLHPAELNRLVWNGPKEFFYQGEMYDLVRTERRGDSSVLLYCLPDTRETELFAMMESFISKRAGNDAQTMHTVKGWFELFSEIYLPASPVIHWSPQAPAATRWAFLDNYHSPVMTKFSPPPQCRPAIS